MKPDPLKNKGFCRAILEHPLDCIEKDTCNARAYKDIDIKSAVEWLEKKIGESNNSDTICMSKGELYEWIDEAFEDVIKKH